MNNLTINTDRLLGRIEELGRIGRDAQGRLVRVAASDMDRLGRDRLVGWLKEAEGQLLGSSATGDYNDVKVVSGSRHSVYVESQGMKDGKEIFRVFGEIGRSTEVALNFTWQRGCHRQAVPSSNSAPGRDRASGEG